MANLLTTKFLQNAYENYGDSVLDWQEDYKDTAVVNAMTVGDHAEFKECMTDFYANDGLLPLYTMVQASDAVESINKFKNYVWAALEATLQEELDTYIESLSESGDSQ